MEHWERQDYLDKVPTSCMTRYGCGRTDTQTPLYVYKHRTPSWHFQSGDEGRCTMAERYMYSRYWCYSSDGEPRYGATWAPSNYDGTSNPENLTCAIYWAASEVTRSSPGILPGWDINLMTFKMSERYRGYASTYSCLPFWGGNYEKVTRPSLFLR